MNVGPIALEDDSRHCMSFAALRQILLAGGQPPDVLFLGDSTFERLANEDADRRTLGRMLLEATADQGIGQVVSKTAYNLRLFRYILAAVSRIGWRPKSVTMIVNLRSFGPIWMGTPEWQFDDEACWLAAVAEGIEPATLALPNGPKSDEAAFLASPLGIPGTACATVAEFRAMIADRSDEAAVRRLTEVFTVYQAFSIPDSHPLLEELRAAVDTARRLGSVLHIYVAPVNVEAGSRYLGDRLRRQLRDNVATIHRALGARLADGEVRLHDFSQAFRASQFLRPEQPTEHLNDLGRQELAARLCRFLRFPACREETAR